MNELLTEKISQLAKIGLENGRDYSDLVDIKPIKGGAINDAFYVRSKDSEYFMKFHASAPKHFFKSESTGLRKLKETGTISVPNYLSYSDKPGNAFLMQEWIEGEKTEQTEEIFGRKLAKLHETIGRMHGFETDTYIGLLPQPNELSANWLNYFRDFRLNSQIKQGIEIGYIKDERQKQLEKLAEQLDKWVPTFVEPSYLHGDLYNGNWIVGPGGEPYVVDPSFLYGDRHFELAYSELLGGLPDKVYEAYRESLPLSDYYEDVKGIYQLYYLIAHLNIFGEKYGPQIDEILQYYVGS